MHIAQHDEIDLAEARRHAHDMLDRIRAGKSAAADTQREAHPDLR